MAAGGEAVSAASASEELRDAGDSEDEAEESSSESSGDGEDEEKENEAEIQRLEEQVRDVGGA